VTPVSQLASEDGVLEEAAVPPPAARAVAATMLRPEPQRVPELAHLDLKRLRRYRQSLLAEEMRVSYWRRLIQARRDLLRRHGALTDRAALTEALTEARSSSGRSAVMWLHPDGGMPILPHLPDLWASGAVVDGEAERAELFSRLSSAESVLSSYREALFKRLDRATEDLVSRYREDPRQCIVALPLEWAASRP
jgi:hypothetical protein